MNFQKYKKFLIIIITILIVIILLDYKQNLISLVTEQFNFKNETPIIHLDEQNIVKNEQNPEEENSYKKEDYLEPTYESDNFNVELIDRMNFVKEGYMPFPVISDKNGYFYTKFSWKKRGIQSSKIVNGDRQDIEFLPIDFHDFSIEDNYLYITASWEILVYKLEEGRMLKEFSVPVDNSFVSIVAKNGILYGANKNGLHAFKKEENNLKEIAFSEIGFIWRIYEDNGYIYINKEGYGQLEVYKLVGNKFFNIDNLTKDNFKVSIIQPKYNRVFIGTEDNNFYVYELDKNKLINKKINLPKFPIRLFINDDNILFYCDNGANLWVYKITDDTAIQLAHFYTKKYPQSIYATNEYLYVSYDNELDIYQFDVDYNFNLNNENLETEKFNSWKAPQKLGT